MKRLECECGVKFKYNTRRVVRDRAGKPMVPCPACQRFIIMVEGIKP